jgi:hypothetical protein
MRWAIDHFKKLTSLDCPVVMMDEKWFYTTNRRRKIKRLPLGLGENLGSDFIPQPKIQSCRYPVKSMFLGAAARPRPDKGFDGRILLERVSNDHVITMRTAHQNFTDDVVMNNELKNGEWRQLYLPNTNMACEEVRLLIGEVFGLDDAIIDRLEFTYKTFIGASGHTKIVTIKDDQAISGLIRVDQDPQIPGRQIQPTYAKVMDRHHVGNVT